MLYQQLTILLELKINVYFCQVSQMHSLRVWQFIHDVVAQSASIDFVEEIYK